MNPAWVTENCEVIVFLQNLQNKEVLQAVKANLSDFGTTNTTDAALIHVAVPQSVCENTVVPKVKIANYGLDNLVSLDIVYQVNNGTPQTYPWSGNLVTYGAEIVELNEIEFTIGSENSFYIHCENPNGQDDQFPSNNAKTVVMDQATEVTSPVNLALKLDDHPEETTWELLNSQGNVLYSGGPYTNGGQYIFQEFQLNGNGCYRFIIYDSGEDGLTGSGVYKLAYMGSMIFAEGKNYGFQDEIQFSIGMTGFEDHLLQHGLRIYPNPMNETATVTFELSRASLVQLTLFGATGEMVYQSEEAMFPQGKHDKVLIRSDLDPGIYFLRLTIDGFSQGKKIVIR